MYFTRSKLSRKHITVTAPVADSDNMILKDFQRDSKPNTLTPVLPLPEIMSLIV